jgi:hypothetical protein
LNDTYPPISATACQVRRVRWSLATVPCDRCHREAPRVWDATRTAIDIDLDQPILLAVVVSVHFCQPCRHYFRAQPSFLRPDAIYSNRVVQKAVEAVFHDGLAMRCVPARLARDFWVQPSEAMVRRWCRAYAAGLDFDADYLPWVVETFSGVLCIDEVYQGKLALLLAVDPAAPGGDRLVGYRLVQGTVEQTAVAAFLRRLKAAGILPEQVITDGSALYPSVLATVWPTAAHQLCLFHETRRITGAIDEVARAARKALPKPPPVSRPTLGGRRRIITPPAGATDVAVERWRWREATRAAGLAQVHALRQRGLSIRAITRETGFNRRTVTRWLREEQPAATPDVPDEAAIRPAGSAPAPETPLPAPWPSWDEVRRVRAALQAARPLLVRRPEHLSPAEQARLMALLASPIGAELQLARAFVEDWYGIWRDERGQRRSLEDARDRYQRWREQPAYRRSAPLRRAQENIDPARFARLSQFLRQPGWEATNNGAERMGRGFRHGQGPHYNLRSAASIEAALTARACLTQAQVIHPAPVLANACRRGRSRVAEPVLAAAA